MFRALASLYNLQWREQRNADGAVYVTDIGSEDWLMSNLKQRCG